MENKRFYNKFESLPIEAQKTSAGIYRFLTEEFEIISLNYEITQKAI